MVALNQQLVAAHFIESAFARHGVGEAGEAAGHQRGVSATRAQGLDQGPGAGIESNTLGDPGQSIDGQAGEQVDAFAQRAGEVDLPGHAARGDCGDAVVNTGGLGQFVDQLLADDGRFHVGHQQALAALSGGLSRQVERCAVEAVADRGLGARERQAVEGQVAGDAGCEPVRRRHARARFGERGGRRLDERRIHVP